VHRSIAFLAHLWQDAEMVLLRRSHRLATPLLLCLALLTACEDEPPPLVLPPVVPIVRPPLLSPRPIATASAFDLVALEGGAGLIFSPASSDGGGVRLAVMDALGSHRGQDPELFASQRPAGFEGPFVPVDAVEVEAAAGGGRLAVVWVARNNGVFSAVAAVGDATGSAFGPVTTLGPTPLRTVGGRGQVGVAVSEAGVAEVRWRAPDGRCDEGSRARCALVRGARLGGDASGREDLPRALPDSCTFPIAGATYAQGVWYFGVCDRTGGQPASTVLGVDFALSYAQSQRILEGCEPMGLMAAADAALAVGRCGAARRLVRIREAGRVLEVVGDFTPEVDCTGAHPVLHAGAFTMALGGSVAHLEALLPDAIAPRGARALWTGRALLVATPIGREVSMHRFQCEHGELSPTSGP